MKRRIENLVYPERLFGGFSRVDGTVHFYSRVQAMLQPADVVLDVGCGRGRRSDDASNYRQRLQDLGGAERTVLGIDVDRAAAVNPFIDEFRLIDDVQSWPVADATIDFLIADYVLEHVETPERFFQEAYRVLKPGGQLALRTPNAHSYVAVVARLIPNSGHARVTTWAQSGRKGIDVFPTRYRCNTRGKLRRVLKQSGFDACVYSIEAEPGYMAFSRLAYRIAAAAHKLFPPSLRTTLLAFGRKR